MGLQKKGFHWGQITGKLSCTPAQALRDFGFGMRPGALGIIFRQYTYTDAEGRKKTGTFINNYFPPSNPQTPTQQANRDRFRILSTIATQNPNLINKIWQPLSQKRDPRKAHGYNEFRSENMKRIGTPPDFAKMMMSYGGIEPTPEVLTIAWSPHPPALFIGFDTEITKNGDPGDYAYSAIYIIPDQRVIVMEPTNPWTRSDGFVIGEALILNPVTDLIGYVWFRRHIRYSPSTSIKGSP